MTQSLKGAKLGTSPLTTLDAQLTFIRLDEMHLHQGELLDLPRRQRLEEISAFLFRQPRGELGIGLGIDT